MSESYKEQHPLLYEDLSEEEKLSTQYQWRRPMVFRGRGRNNVKGAAAIIRLWPEHWSSSVAYWWIGLGMVALITIIVYNTVVLFSMLPASNPKETKLRSNTLNPMLTDPPLTVNVYMHLFVDNNNVIDLNNYIPYIDVIANKYSNFKYHLIIVSNDTHGKIRDMSAEDNNVVALNSLWAKSKVNLSQRNNIDTKHVTLSKYMNDSPLQEHWEKLPKQFLEFFTRAVSIWDKGGIAFNPDILMPGSPHSIYKEKVQNLLKHFHHSSKNNLKQIKLVKKPHPGSKKKLNNIRDIIDALENEDNEFPKPSQNSPEDKQNIKEINKVYEPVSSPLNPIINETVFNQKVKLKINNFTETLKDYFKSPDSQESLVMAESKLNDVSVKLPKQNDTNTMSLLPKFIEYFFRNKPNLDSPNHKSTTLTRKRKHVTFIDKPEVDESYPAQHLDGTNKRITNRPMKISSKSVNYIDPKNTIETNKDISETSQFTIDLKGNIVTSEMPCHAFLGTMFSNAAHHTQESLTDLIITELLIFCKGTLSSCKGMDVILL